VPTPLVAVPAPHLTAGRVAHWASGGYGIPDTYVAALRRAGVRPVLLTSPEPAPPDEVLAPFAGLVLIGGGDVEPSRYGAERMSNVYGVEPSRDALELGLARRAGERCLPTLAICRGMQVVNVERGGTLHQHLPAVEGMGAHGPVSQAASTAHDVKVVAGSRLATCVEGAAVIRDCPSQHHQGVDRLGAGLVATAWSDDGLIEAVEGEDEGWWLLAVQWHPERAAAGSPAHQAVFDAFGAATRGDWVPAA